MSICNSNKGMININYINYLLKAKPIKPYMNINMLNGHKYASNVIKMNSRYLNIEYEHFSNNRTILIQSDTGTGKTTCISKNIKILMNEYKQLQCISLVPRISLSHQHIKNFKNNDINLVSYQDLNKKNSKEYEYYNIVCCINSLLLFKDFDNKIIFIDEVDSFIQSIIDNTTIKEQKQIYALLM